MAARMMVAGIAVIVPPLHDDEELVIAAKGWTTPSKVIKIEMAASKEQIMVKQLRAMALKEKVKATVQIAWRWPQAWLQVRRLMCEQDKKANDNYLHKMGRAKAKAKAAGAKAKPAARPKAANAPANFPAPLAAAVPQCAASVGSPLAKKRKVIVGKQFSTEFA
jgi:hypothetical protein